MHAHLSCRANGGAFSPRARGGARPTLRVATGWCWRENGPRRNVLCPTGLVSNRQPLRECLPRCACRLRSARTPSSVASRTSRPLNAPLFGPRATATLRWQHRQIGRQQRRARSSSRLARAGRPQCAKRQGLRPKQLFLCLRREWSILSWPRMSSTFHRFQLSLHHRHQSTATPRSLIRPFTGPSMTLLRWYCGVAIGIRSTKLHF